jgi:hypothetical protein
MILQSGSFTCSGMPLAETYRPDIYAYMNRIYFKDEKASVLHGPALDIYLFPNLVFHMQSLTSYKESIKANAKVWGKFSKKKKQRIHQHLKKIKYVMYKEDQTNLAITKSSLTILEPSPMYF